MGDAPRVAQHSSLDQIAFKELSAHLSRPQDKFSAMCFLPELQIQQARGQAWHHCHASTGGSGASFPGGTMGTQHHAYTWELSSSLGDGV